MVPLPSYLSLQFCFVTLGLKARSSVLMGLSLFSCIYLRVSLIELMFDEVSIGLLFLLFVVPVQVEQHRK